MHYVVLSFGVYCGWRLRKEVVWNVCSWLCIVLFVCLYVLHVCKSLKHKIYHYFSRCMLRFVPSRKLKCITRAEALVMHYNLSRWYKS